MEGNNLKEQTVQPHATTNTVISEELPSVSHHRPCQEEVSHHGSSPKLPQNDLVITDLSDLDSISEHIPSNQNYSLSLSDNNANSIEIGQGSIHQISNQGLEVAPSNLKVDSLEINIEENTQNSSHISINQGSDKTNVEQTKSSSSNIEIQKTIPSKDNGSLLEGSPSSWPSEVRDGQNISAESSVHLVISSELSRNENTERNEDKPKLEQEYDLETVVSSPEAIQAMDDGTKLVVNKPSSSTKLDQEFDLETASPDVSKDTEEGPKYVVHEPSSSTKLDQEIDLDSIDSSPDVSKAADDGPKFVVNEPSSSSSEEMDILDIRGTSTPKIPFSVEKIIYGAIPEGAEVIPLNDEAFTGYPGLLSSFLIGAGDGMNVEEVFRTPDKSKDASFKSTVEEPQSLVNSFTSSKSDQKDLLVEELLVDSVIENEPKVLLEKDENPQQVEDVCSFSTVTTDYRTLCEDYHEKLTNLEAAINHKDNEIERLATSLQTTAKQKEILQNENEHLVNEVHNLQHIISEQSIGSDHNMEHGQISDLMKYESMIKEENTKFFSVLTSDGSDKSSNGEKDMEHEEITVDHSRSDVMSSIVSNEFQSGLEAKISETFKPFEGSIEENICNQLKECILNLFNEELNKIRLENDSELKECESQMKRDRDAFSTETRKLRELLESVKTDNVDICKLRKELSVKHEAEMNSLRKYYEKKFSETQRSFSEEVYRGRSQEVALAGGDDVTCAGAGDADFMHDYQIDNKNAYRKLEQQMEQMKADHLGYVTDLEHRHRDTIIALEDEIKQLKAHIQTAENTESAVSLYNQDIDLELEKCGLEELKDDPKYQTIWKKVSQHFVEEIQVLLSDPDAEPSSWPSELIALRDKLRGDVGRNNQDKELSSAREDLSGSETDRWRQKRNHNFDQNRHLEQVTKQRDRYKHATGLLHGVVAALARHCVNAEEEINHSFLPELFERLHLTSLEDELKGQSPNTSDAGNTSAVSVTSRHVHFAPELPSVLAELDEERLLAYLQEQHDLSLEIKRELELSMQTLRNEAQEMYNLCCRLNPKSDMKALEANSVKITELVEEIDSRQLPCDRCEMVKKSAEESISEYMDREVALQSQLDAAMSKIAHLLADQHDDVIAEGVGALSPPLQTVSRPPPPELSSPRSDVAALAHDLDLLLREKEDLAQQLEAANRQLRKARQFVDDMASEREGERLEFDKQLERVRQENAKLSSRLEVNARMLSEVEPMELQITQMKQIIDQLEATKTSLDEKLRLSNEKNEILRDIISNMESQLEQKICDEKEVLVKLEEMKQTIDERDSKMRSLISELESLRSERVEQSADMLCVKCTQMEEVGDNFEEIVKEHCLWLERRLRVRAQQLARVHAGSPATPATPASTPEGSEDVSRADAVLDLGGPASPPPPSPRAPCLRGLGAALAALENAQAAALKYVRDLTRTAQEVRAERDVLQARMSEQAFKISSLSARLEQHRSHADAATKQAAGDLCIKLHDANSEVQRLKEELESKDKQLTRLKQTLEEREKLANRCDKLYGNTRNPQDKVTILERELAVVQSRADQLEDERDELRATLEHRDLQLNQLMALKLEDDNNKSDHMDGAKNSGRTLSDIVSISEYDEQDLQMRRAELKHNMTTPFATEFRENNLSHNKTLPPDVQRHNMSLNIESTDNFDLINNTPKANSLPLHVSTLERTTKVNKSDVFGTIEKFGDNVKHSTAQKIPDNCSLYPNRDISDSKDISLEPKKINFSLEPSKIIEEDFTSLRELGITLDVKQENFPDILSQLKHEIKKSRSELVNCKSELKNAEDQLCEFPALKEEVEELKALLENALSTMDSDKKFYETQLNNFQESKEFLDERLKELTDDVEDKSKDLHLLKEDLLKRENMILELAKEKRNLTKKMADLEIKINELQSRNVVLDKYESENKDMKEKIVELRKLEHLVSEKNQQIDSLNQHLDRLDDLQRRLTDKNDELEQLKESSEEKSNEIYNLQEIVTALNKDLANTHEDNEKLNLITNDLKHKLTKLEKEHKNQSLKHQSDDLELQRLQSLNNELTSNIEELKQLSIRLKDKETEVEILNEDINCYHEEIASLKDQLKMVSRSPSPRKNSVEDKPKSVDRQASNDKKQLVKIRKQISLLQHELDFNKKELNEKAYELAKAKLDLTELTTQLSETTKQLTEQQMTTKQLQALNNQQTEQLEELNNDKHMLSQQLAQVVNRLREESNVSELKQKLKSKIEECSALERELQIMKDVMENNAVVESGAEQALVPRGSRSPTLELERALKDQLDYSTRLDDDIMDQILSASSDNEEVVPRLPLNTSRSSSSIHCSSSERVQRLRVENDRLTTHVHNLEARIKDKDALIVELNRVRDKLVSELQTVQLKRETEKDNCSRLQLMLNTHKEASNAVQKQDASMIEMLKRRLESAMQAEQLLQQTVLELKAQRTHHTQQSDIEDRLKSEASILRSKLEVERSRYQELQMLLDQSRVSAQRDLDDRGQHCAALTEELHLLRRLKHEAGVELIRAKELLEIQSETIADLEKKLAKYKQNPYSDTMSEVQRSDLGREIASLKRCLIDSQATQQIQLVDALREEKQRLIEKVERLEKELQSKVPLCVDDKDQAIRYLHNRCHRLLSYRKALIWQKRYLMKVVAGYVETERRLSGASSGVGSTGRYSGGFTVPAPRKTFRSVASAVLACCRVRLLVRLRRQQRAVAEGALLQSTQPPRSDVSPFPSRGTPLASHQRHLYTNLNDLMMKAGPVFSSSPKPRDEPFVLNSRADSAAAVQYSHKLDLVSRCLNQAMNQNNKLP